MPRITGKSLGEMSWEDIKGMNRSTAREYLKKARSLYGSRKSSFDKTSMSIVSPALRKMEEYYASQESTGKIPISKITLGKAQSELYRLTKFFGSKSSTIKGSREISTEQDITIFGANKMGKPNKRLNKRQRENFWDLYNEYLNTYKTADAIYGSGKIQQFLGDMVYGSRSNLDVNADTLQALQLNLQWSNTNPFKTMSDRAEEDVRNVYSGGWNSK